MTVNLRAVGTIYTISECVGVRLPTKAAKALAANGFLNRVGKFILAEAQEAINRGPQNEPEKSTV